MKIDGFKKNTNNGLTRVEATITWEDADRPSREIYIETDARFADDISPNPNAFLLAAIMPAMHHGEKRVLLTGKICPHLRNGLITAMLHMRTWYGVEGTGPIAIEATEGFEPTYQSPPQRTASFMSGGVDALATLRSNRLDFPKDHPASIQDCFFVHGFDIGGYETLPDNRENSNFAISSLTQFTEQAGISLIPIYTNMRYLDVNDGLFALKSHGASLAAIAHAFSSRISTALIASSDCVGGLAPWGSHPILDYNYSCYGLDIRHDAERFSRLQKVRLIAEWDEALQTLRSCYDAFRPSNELNCGKCEKCLRTMTALLVCGKLKQCQTYKEDDVSAEQLRTLRVNIPAISLENHKQRLEMAYIKLNPGTAVFWHEMIAPLNNIGRHDLVEVIEDKLAELETYQKRITRNDAIKAFDHKFLGSALTKANKLRKAAL